MAHHRALSAVGGQSTVPLSYKQSKTDHWLECRPRMPLLMSCLRNIIVSSGLSPTPLLLHAPSVGLLDDVCCLHGLTQIAGPFVENVVALSVATAAHSATTIVEFD